MNEKTRTGLEILQASILLGILSDLLLRQTPPGLNVFVFVILLVSAIVVLTFRRNPGHFNLQSIALYAAAVFFSFTFMWRDSLELRLFSLFAILTIFAVQMLPALNIKANVGGLVHYVIAGVWAAISVGLGPLILLIGDIKWKTLPKTGNSKHLVSIVKGLAIALPIFFVFGALFMAADAVYEGLVRNTFRIDPEAVVSHAVFISIGFWLVAGYLRGSILDIETASGSALLNPKNAMEGELKPQIPSVTLDISEDPPVSEVKTPASETTDAEKKAAEEKWDWRKFDNSALPASLTLGPIEIGIVLGLINLLFLSFVIVQLPYLFGGIELVQTTPDFKLAQYARRGFGELIAVASLVLPILLVTHWLIRKDKPLNERLFRILAGIQIGLLFIIMISAFQRLLLLTGNLGYGLTADRFYSMAFIVFLGIVFVIFGLTVLRGSRENFAWGALWSGLVLLAVLHVLNPDDLIVRTNVRLMQEGRDFDANYNGRLSQDAVPALLESIPFMEPTNRETTARLLRRRHCEDTNTDLRTWNWSRSRARALLSGDSEIALRNCSEAARSDLRD